MRTIVASVSVALLAGPALAQPADPGPFQAAFDTCVEGAEDAREMAACTGQSARACQAQDGGQTTLGMTACFAMETGLWDAKLNADWPEVKAWAAAADDEDRPFFDGRFSNRLDSLIAAQRAWIAFRDAECGLDYALWGSGSMRQIAGTACRMEMTADRVIRLRFLADHMR
ncbi:MAG: lysozyme inhibitor LprI family protein [Pseudomonadota bacterium]